MTIIQGITTDGKSMPMLVDASGRPLIVLQYPSGNNLGGTIERVDNLNLAAGTNFLLSSAVPAGQRWILEYASASYVGTITGVVLTFYISSGGSACFMNAITPIVSAQFYGMPLSLTLNAGDIPGVRVTSATLNNDLYFSAFTRRIL